MLGGPSASLGHERRRAGAPDLEVSCMAARKRTHEKTALTSHPKNPPKRKSERPKAFRLITDGLYELHLGARVALDLLVTVDGDVMTFLRIDGALLGEIPVLGEA